jgi:hypothetical protein
VRRRGDRCRFVPDDFGLRPTLGQQAKTGTGTKGDLQPRSFGSTPGDGAGKTGFISTNLPKSGAKQAVKASSGNAANTTSAPAAAKLAARVRQAIEDDTTGSVPRRPVPRAEEEEPYAQIGLRAGSFDVKPSVEVHGGYDDNTFRVRTGARGSSFTGHGCFRSVLSPGKCHDRSRVPALADRYGWRQLRNR